MVHLTVLNYDTIIIIKLTRKCRFWIKVLTLKLIKDVKILCGLYLSTDDSTVMLCFIETDVMESVTDFVDIDGLLFIILNTSDKSLPYVG